MLSVLIVEDDELQGGLLENILKRLGYQPVLTKWARKAIEYAQTNPIDFILLDLNLPDLHGLEVLNILKSNPKTNAIPIIVITGSQFGEDKTLAWASGCDGYIHKPIRPNEVRAYLFEFAERLNTTSWVDENQSFEE
jgi:DNA-binding response OmpR family regulator